MGHVLVEPLGHKNILKLLRQTIPHRPDQGHEDDPSENIQQPFLPTKPILKIIISNVVLSEWNFLRGRGKVVKVVWVGLA